MTTPDWSLAPEGATHFNHGNDLWYRRSSGGNAEVLHSTGWSLSCFSNRELDELTETFATRPVATRKENAMNAITELTMRDLLDRAANFAESALAFAGQCAPFTYVNFSQSHSTLDPQQWPLSTVHIDLAHSAPDRTFPMLTDANGKVLESEIISEGPMAASRDRTMLTLRLPLGVIATRSFMQRLFALTDATYEETHFCVYARGWKRQASLPGLLPETLPDFSDTRWKALDPSNHSGDSSCFPQLGLSGKTIRAFKPGDYHSGFTIATDEPVWRLRESARLNLGHYDKLPDDVVIHLDPEKAKHTFPHISQKATNAGMVAFTESGAKGALDRQSVMKPGRFIRQYGYGSLTDEDVKQLAAKIMAATRLVYKHSREREDYARVYQTGPNSCMAYGPLSSRGTFQHTYVDGEFVHPAEVYAHPDNNLELVWGELDGQVVSRVVVNTRTKTYTRIYGKENISRSKEKLKDYLADLGYCQDNTAFDGEKLLLLHPDSYPEAIICPYIDPSNRGVSIHDDHLTVGGYEQADHETGCLFLYGPSAHTWTCTCCGNHYGDADSQYSDQDDDSICEGCLDNHTYAYSIPHGDSRYIHDGETVYRLTGPLSSHLRHYDYVYVGHSSLSDEDLVELSSDLYDEALAADISHCIEYEDGDYVLESDMSDFNLFYDEDDRVARDIDEWAVLREVDGSEQLTRRHRIDTDNYAYDRDEESDISPMLPVFVAIEDDEDEDEELAEEAA